MDFKITSSFDEKKLKDKLMKVAKESIKKDKNKLKDICYTAICSQLNEKISKDDIEDIREIKEDVFEVKVKNREKKIEITLNYDFK